MKSYQREIISIMSIKNGYLALQLKGRLLNQIQDTYFNQLWNVFRDNKKHLSMIYYECSSWLFSQNDITDHNAITQKVFINNMK